MASKILKNQILQVVENQMNMNEPKCVNSTFDRLLDKGCTNQEAKEMIGAAMMEEMYIVLKENTPFNEKRYEEKLNGLGHGLVSYDDVESKKAVRPIAELIEVITYNTGTFPQETLRDIIHEKEQAIPFLLEILSNTSKNPEKYTDPNYFGHIYAAYLLAQFRVTDAYPLLIDLMSLTGDQSYDLFGDFILEAGSRMLASVCGGDTSLIKRLVENENADEYMRTQAIEALAILAIQGLVENGEVVDYFRELLQETSIRNNPLILAFLVISCCDMYAEELYENLNECYRVGLVDETVIDVDDFEDEIKLGREQSLQKSLNNASLQLIDDTIAEMKHWHGFKDNTRKMKDVWQDLDNLITVIKSEKVGRNNPCPCGSGKKYKKCCGK